MGVSAAIFFSVVLLYVASCMTFDDILRFLPFLSVAMLLPSTNVHQDTLFPVGFFVRLLSISIASMLTNDLFCNLIIVLFVNCLLFLATGC